MKKKIIGYAAVDSGQLMVCDPCYIKDHWKDTEFRDVRVYRHKKTGRVFAYGMNVERDIKVDEEFPHYEAKTSTGKTMNEMMRADELEEVDTKEDVRGEFSYAGACEATMSKDGGGAMRFNLGHEGAGVAFRTGWGDGLYPVTAHYGEGEDEGRIMKITIDF